MIEIQTIKYVYSPAVSDYTILGSALHEADTASESLPVRAHTSYETVRVKLTLPKGFNWNFILH